MALSEEQLELLGNRLVPIYQQFERAVINDVVRRLVKAERLTETAEIMAETLRDKGFSPAAIRAQVMKAINADKKLQEAIAVNTLEMKQLVLDEIKMLRENARNFLYLTANYLVQQSCGSTLRLSCRVSVDIHRGTYIRVT